MVTPTWTGARRVCTLTTSASSAPSRTRRDAGPSRAVRSYFIVHLYVADRGFGELARRFERSNSENCRPLRGTSNCNDTLVDLSGARPIFVLFAEACNFRWESWAQFSQPSGASFNFQPRHQSPSRRRTWLSDATRPTASFRTASAPATGRLFPAGFSRTR